MTLLDDGPVHLESRRMRLRRLDKLPWDEVNETACGLISKKPEPLYLVSMSTSLVECEPCKRSPLYAQLKAQHE